MSEAGKVRRRDRAALPKEWTKEAVAEPRPHAAPPPEKPEDKPEEKPEKRPEKKLEKKKEDDAVGGLLGTTTLAPTRRLRAWQKARRGAIPIVVLGIATPFVIWMQYQSQYVTSKNAVVRGHLAEIGSRLTGQVTKVEVDVGDKVVAGQVLVRLEDRHLRAELEAARADVEGLRRTIEIEQLDIVHERRKLNQQANEAAAKIAAADAQTEGARIRAEDARRNYEMRETLLSRDGVVSREDVRDADTLQQTAAARLDEAKANSLVAKSAGQTVRLEGEGLTIQERRIGVLETDLQRAEARVARAQADVDGALIRAPENGSIVRRIAQPGGSVEAGRPIIAMKLGDEVWVEAWVDEDDIGSVGLASVATVTFPSLPGREFTGAIDQIGITTDLEVPDADVPKPRSSRMRSAPVVGVRIRLEAPPPELVPGLSAVVAIRKAG